LRSPIGVSFYIGAKELILSAAIALVVVSVLDCSPPIGTALGIVLVPFVALATSRIGPETAPAKRDAAEPVRGVCRCGHMMSMHCHADCSGPCAVPNCPCEGRA
jgi:hypothetical protein